MSVLIVYLVVYSFFVYLEDEGCELMMVVVCEVREIILKNQENLTF